MKIQHVERYIIPIEQHFNSKPSNTQGTKVRDLYAALGKMPNGGIVSTGYTESDLIVTYVLPDIDVEWVAEVE